MDKPITWTARELELINGMIGTQLHHAAQCDHMANRIMADKQKGWDMERVALLEKIKFIAQAQKNWVALTNEEAQSLRADCINTPIDLQNIEYGWAINYARAIEAKLKEKNS